MVIFMILWSEFKSLAEVVDSGIKVILSAMAIASVQVSCGIGGFVMVIFMILWSEFKSLAEVVDSSIKVPLSAIAVASIQVGCGIV
jgi:hypothetical protein